MRPGQAGSTEAYDRPWKRVSTAAFSLAAEQEQPTARVPGAGGWQRRPQARADSVLFAEPPQPKRRVFLRRKVLFLLRPLNAGRRLFPRKRHADGFGATFCHQKVAIRRGTRRGSVFSAGQRSEHANKGCSSLFACSRFLQGEDRRSGVPMAQVRKFFVLLPLVRREYEDEC